jgi:hypothetical protein
MKKQIFKLSLSLLLLVATVFFFSCEKEETLEFNTESLENVLESEAELVAINFINANDPNQQLKSKSTEKKEIEEVLIIPDENNEPALYVVNFKSKGFVIIPGTKKETPVLAYSETSSFDVSNAPPGVQQWIIARKKKIKALKDKDVIVLDDIEERWRGYISPPDPNTGDETDDPDYDPELDPGNSNYLTMRTITKGPLLSTTWEQENDFNAQINSNQPVGCVGLAMAQVMKYHQFPNTYNWSAMPDHASAPETARLLKDIWVATESWYDPVSENSLSSLIKARDALISNFDYSSVTFGIFKHEDSYLKNVIKEINFNRPVIMDGAVAEDDPFGHAWVCDGYSINEYYRNITKQVVSTEEFLHMNWGFRGKNDGYFAMNSFTITIKDAPVSFNHDNLYLFNIKPGNGTAY